MYIIYLQVQVYFSWNNSLIKSDGMTTVLFRIAPNFRSKWKVTLRSSFGRSGYLSDTHTSVLYVYDFDIHSPETREKHKLFSNENQSNTIFSRQQILPWPAQTNILLHCTLCIKNIVPYLCMTGKHLFVRVFIPY